ncbi:MAG TPA: BMP family ABC transporter substrate-binding protein [Conexibacter sp.]|nr:BMP family ABC transporter substrate-binding protein [Conexibacter sp.]
MRRLTILGALIGCAAIVFAGCGSSTSSSGGGSGATKVALILNGPADDGGWNTIWQQSVARLRSAVPKADVTVVPNITAGADAQRTLQTLAQQGNKLIVLTGGYADADVRKAARDYPDTKFMNLFGSQVSSNMSPFSTAIEQGRYLDGIVAGMATRSNVLGEVGGYPIAFEARTLNAFAQGVHSVNPQAKVKILWVNSFYDPAKERQAAQALVDAGADVLVMDSNTPAVSSVARAKNVKLVGYGISREKDAPRQWLGTFTFDWAPYLIEWTRDVQSGDLKSQLYYEGIKQGVIGSTPWGESVSSAAASKAAAARKQIVDGSLNVFTGPLQSNTGKTVVPSGQALTTPAQLNPCCTWLSDNVEGNLGQSGG